MGTTPTYSWPYPESTDFVADGATAIENLADAIDTTVSGFGNWTAFTPTITSAGGTLTTVTQNVAIYITVNDLVIYYLDVTLNNIGTGTGNLRSTLPVTAQSALPGTCFGREVNLTGHSLNGELANTGAVIFLKYDGSSPIATNARLRVVTTYRAQ